MRGTFERHDAVASALFRAILEETSTHFQVSSPVFNLSIWSFAEQHKLQMYSVVQLAAALYQRHHSRTRCTELLQDNAAQKTRSSN